jgi:hypothetical protein
MIDPLLKAEKKKKKMMMKLAAEAATQEAPALNGNATEDTDATKKMRKKARKITEQGMQPPEPDIGAPLGEPDKKKKKKKRKAANAEGQVAEAKPAEEQPADAQAVAPDQKAKKKKSVQQSSEPELAAVGDRELARSGKPIMKALYSEHAAVTALTPAEVDAWRAERDTVVTGCDMKPVMSFDQSGTPPSEHASTLPCNIFLDDFCQVDNTPVCGVVCALDGWRCVCVGWDLRSEGVFWRRRVLSRSAAVHADVCTAFAHPGAVLANHPVRQGSSGHRCHWLRQNAGLWPARPQAHPGTEGRWGQHRCSCLYLHLFCACILGHEIHS